MSRAAIFSFCFADIPFVLSAWKHEAKHHEKPLILAASQKLRSRIIDLAFDNEVLMDYHSVVCDLSSSRNLASFSKIYLFTLGTLPICRIVLKALSAKVPVYYKDCYFSLLYYDYRLINPFFHILSGYRSALCSPIEVLKQLLRQIRHDPFRRKLYFSGDSHCWLSKSIVYNLCVCSLDPLRLRLKVTIPPKALIFTLNSTENNVPINWNFFQASGFNLYYKHHQLKSSDYSCYPK